MRVAQISQTQQNLGDKYAKSRGMVRSAFCVNLAVAGNLQKKGLIKDARGTITMLDRKGLQITACECYQVVKEEYDRLLGKYISKNR